MLRRSSAVAFHNGTVEYIGSNSASMKYTSTMRSVMDRYVGQPPQRRVSSCRMPQPREPMLPSSYFQNVFHYFITWQRSWSQQLAADSFPTSVHPNAYLFRKEIEALAPFVHMSSEQRSRLSVALVFPGWLTETEELCQIVDAAARTFDQVFVADHPSAVYTAMGYELCRTPDSQFDCEGPHRITTVDIQSNDLVSTTLSKMPMYHWVPLEATSVVSKGMNNTEMGNLIDSFISTHRPDLVMITGLGAHSHRLQHFIERSQTGPLIEDQSLIPAEKVAVMGAAQFAKDTLERRFDGCWELPECLDIRREADRVAGKFSPPVKPSIWPLANGRTGHVHEEL